MSTPTSPTPPIRNAPAQPVSDTVELAEGYEDYGSCCVQWMPASSMGLYLKFFFALVAVFGGISVGAYLLIQAFVQ